MNDVQIAASGVNTGDVDGAEDNFGPTCNSHEPGSGRSDHVWSYTVQGGNVNVTFEETTSFDAMFSVRETCALPEDLYCADITERYTAEGARQGDVFYIVMDAYFTDPTTSTYELKITEVPIVGVGRQLRG